jgi:hypothetical protein
VHGIAETDARVAAGRQPSYTPRYEAARDFAGSLGLLAEAHRYFARVLERHPDSVWAADAKLKLRRIERFTRLYRRILSNLGASSSQSRNSETWPPTGDPASASSGSAKSSSTKLSTLETTLARSRWPTHARAPAAMPMPAAITAAAEANARRKRRAGDTTGRRPSAARENSAR